MICASDYLARSETIVERVRLNPVLVCVAFTADQSSLLRSISKRGVSIREHANVVRQRAGDGCDKQKGDPTFYALCSARLA